MPRSMIPESRSASSSSAARAAAARPRNTPRSSARTRPSGPTSSSAPARRSTEQLLAGDRHVGHQDLAVRRVGDEELLAAERDVGHQAVLAPGVHEMRRQAVGIEAPDADAEMADAEPVLVVELDAVRAGVAPGEWEGDPRF